MAREIRPIDVSRIPALLHIAEEVGRSGEARILRSADKDLALVVPAASLNPKSRTGKAKTKADLAAFHAAAGSWKDVDTNALLADIRESRRSSRPPVDL